MWKERKRTFQLPLRTVSLSFGTRQRTLHDSTFQNENQENVWKTLSGCSLLHIPPREPLLGHIGDWEVPASKRLMRLCQPPLGFLHLNKGNFTPEKANSVDRDTNTAPLHTGVSTVKRPSLCCCGSGCRVPLFSGVNTAKTNCSSYKWPNTVLSKVGLARKPVVKLILPLCSIPSKAPWSLSPKNT